MTEYNTKVCTKCKRELPATTEWFCKHLSCKYGLNSQCKDCRTRAKDGIRKIREVWPEGFQRCSKCKVLHPSTTDYFFKEKSGRLGLCSICKHCRAKSVGRNPTQPMDKDVKRCAHCENIYPATYKYFQRDAHIRRDGLCSICKKCRAAKQREFRRRHREALRPGEQARSSLRQARKRNAAGEFTKEDIDKIFQLQKGRCWYCQEKLEKYHIDHRVPIVRGGTNWPSNLVLACPFCNLSKHDRLPHEWSDRLL